MSSLGTKEEPGGVLRPTEEKAPWGVDTQGTTDVIEMSSQELEVPHHVPQKQPKGIADILV